MRSRQFGRRFERSSGQRDARPSTTTGPPPPRSKVIPCEIDKMCASLRCAECLKRIPPEEMVTSETEDYVRHFCGLRCLRRWELRRSP